MTEPKGVTPDEMIQVLNEAIDLDEEAIRKLFQYRVECNEELADHPVIQVRDEGEGVFSISLLGILNGLFGTIGEGEREKWGWITMECDYFEDTGELGKIRRFVRTEVK